MSGKRFPGGILATCVIPWDEKNRLMEGMFREEIRLSLRETPLLYVMGTAGEGYALSEEQYQLIVEVFTAEMKAGHAEPMVGIISMSVTDVHRKIELGQALGVSLFQVSLPGWGPCTEKEIMTFFREVCGGHPDCRFLHYNLLRSRVLVTPAQYRSIADRHENLVATKNTTDSLAVLSGLIRGTPQVQHFLADIALPFGWMVGECGLLVSIASTNWKTARRYYELCRTGQTAAAMDLQADLVQMVAEIRAMVEPHAHMDGSFDKMFARLHMPGFPLRLLPPYEGVPEDVFELYRSLLRQRFPRWLPE